HIIGVIHEKDFYELIYRNQTSLRKIVKPVVYTSPNTKISQLLKKLQTNKTHMAVVLDEFGGTDGIITVEDIIEELVGEIWDEHDIVEEFYTKINDTTYLIKGDAEVDDMFDRFDIEDDDEDEGYISVSGWVIYRLGHIPEVGESFDYKNLHVTVTEADQRTVLQVKVTIQETETDKEDE
ncbi:MAG: CBS domain-containing protein, partial [Solobacterium sp.]|nr:CBS domain-containing protein [Solobacterium sp.]